MPNERLTVICIAPIRDLAFLPDNRLTTGRSQRTFRIQARLEANRAIELPLQLVPPPASPAVRYVVGPPLAIHVVGPPPIPLVHCNRGRPESRLDLTISDEASTITFDLHPTPYGLDPAAAPTPVAARVTTTDSRYKPTPDLLPLFTDSVVHCSLPRDSGTLFFVDHVFDVSLRLQPDHPTTALRPTTLILHVTREAPLRRLLFRLSVVAGGLVLVGTLVVLYVRLRRTEPLSFENTDLRQTAA